MDYPVGGAVNGCPALLVEPAATNLNPNSNTFSVETAPVATVVQNQVDPFGNPNSAWLMSGADSAADSASANNVRIIQSSLASNVYTCSIYIKSPTGSPVTFRYRQTAGGVISGSTVVSGSGFQRIQLTSPNTDTSSRFIIYTTGGEPIIISCHQVEAGTVATSYIPTTTQAITRAADVINKTSIASLIGQTEGTIYAEVDARNFTSGARIFAISDGTQDNRIAFLFNSTNRIRALISFSVTTQFDANTSTGLSSGIYKLAVAYANNDFAFYVNGSQIATDNTGSVPACSQVFIGKTESTSTTNICNDRIRAVAIYPNRLSNSELATLTTP
jgi:hypothetical protein